MNKKFFAIVAGPRLGGKTTLAGTLPGRTIMLQAAVKESGSRSARRLAKLRGNDLTVETFADLPNLFVKLAAIAGSPEYDHVYIDGYSAINEMKWREEDVQKYARRGDKAVWDAYRVHGDYLDNLVERIKMLTESDAEHPKNVFLTCALRVKEEGQDVELEAKGRMAVTAITKLGEAVVTVLNVPREGGALERVMLTKDHGKWPGRVDGILDDENPGVIAPDLGVLLQLAEGTDG